MKIIKEGKLPKDKIYKATCGNCNTVFEYQGSDIENDQRDGNYVKCPLKGCGAYISTDTKHYYNEKD